MRRLSTWAAAYVLTYLMLLSGAQGCARLAATGDPLVIRAEGLERGATLALDVFLAWEYRAQPGGTVHRLAEEMRLYGPMALRDLRAVTRTYKHGARDAAGQRELDAAMLAVERLLARLSQYATDEQKP